MSNEIPTVSFDDIIFLVFDAENKSNIKSKNTYENPNLRMNNPYTIPQIYMPNRTSSHVQQDCPSRFQSLSWNSLPNISSQRNHRFPSLDESQRNHRFPSLDESQISVQHPPCLPNIGSPPRKLPKRGNPYTIGSNSSLQFQPNFSSSFESDSPPTNYSGSGNTPNRAFRGGEQSPDRQMHNSHPPIVPNDMSPSPLMSSANSSRSPSPSVPILPCQQPPCPSLCFPTYDSHCNTELYYSYDKELAEIRVREEELCKLEEEKRKEAEELNRQVQEVKRQELQIKKKELEIIKKRDDERRREELRRLDCLKEEETRKLEREFEYRQKCLREEHELELELLRRKEKEMVAFEIARFKDPIDELCEITKIDRTFESIEAEFKECNHLNPENEDICRLREEHSETVSNLDAAHNDSYGGTQQQPVIRSPSPKKKKLFPSLKKKMELPLKKMELPLKKMELPLKKIKMFEPHFEKNRKVESPVEKFTKVYLPPCANGKIIIKHEATVCNGGDCCTYSGPSCTLIPNSTIVDRNNKTEYNRETGISYNSSGNNELTRSREVSPYISNDDDDDYESSICEKLCSQCQQDINRETDNHCCLEERRIHNDQERQCLKKFKRRKEAKINVANSSLNINTRRNSKSQSSRRGSPSRKLKLNFMDRRKKKYHKYIFNDEKRHLTDEKKSSVVNVPVGSILNLRYSGQKKRLRPVKKYEVRTAMFSPEYQSLPSSILKESYIDKNLDLDVNFNIPYKKPYINLEDSFESLKISQLYDSTTDLNHNRIINVDEYNPFIPYLKSSYTDSERNISNSVFRDSGDNSDESTTSVIEEEIDWSDLEFQENDVSSCTSNSNLFIIHSDRSDNAIISRSSDESLINFGSLSGSSDTDLLNNVYTQIKQLPEKESKAVPKDMEILAHNYLNEMDDHIIPLEERLKRVQRPFEETSSDESYTTSSEKKRNPKSSKKRKSFFKRHFDFF